LLASRPPPAPRRLRRRGVGDAGRARPAERHPLAGRVRARIRPLARAGAPGRDGPRGLRQAQTRVLP